MKPFYRSLDLVLLKHNRLWVIKGDINSRQISITPLSDSDFSRSSNVCLLSLEDEFEFDIQVTPSLSAIELKQFIKNNNSINKMRHFFVDKFHGRNFFKKQKFFTQKISLSEKKLNITLKELSKNLNGGAFLGVFPLLTFLPRILKLKSGVEVTGWWIFLETEESEKINLYIGCKNNFLMHVCFNQGEKNFEDFIFDSISRAVLYLRRYNWNVEDRLQIFSDLSFDILDQLKEKIPSNVLFYNFCFRKNSLSLDYAHLSGFHVALIKETLSEKIINNKLFSVIDNYNFNIIKKFFCLEKALIFLTSLTFIAFMSLGFWQPKQKILGLDKQILEKQKEIENAKQSFSDKINIGLKAIPTDRLIKTLKELALGERLNYDSVFNALLKIGGILNAVESSRVIDLKFESYKIKLNILVLKVDSSTLKTLLQERFNNIEFHPPKSPIGVQKDINKLNEDKDEKHEALFIEIKI